MYIDLTKAKRHTLRNDCFYFFLGGRNWAQGKFKMHYDLFKLNEDLENKGLHSYFIDF